MGLISEAQQDLIEAFNDDLSEVVVSFDLIASPTTGEYDVEDSVRESDPVIFPSRGIFAAYPSNKIDGKNIIINDEQLIIIASEIEQCPKIDDEIITGNGLKYIVINDASVLGGGSPVIIYDIQVRKND